MTIKPNYRTISYEVEAFFYAGQPYDKLPDWIRAVFSESDMALRAVGRYALRDDEGNFWRWMDPEVFNRRYTRINP